jgi:hypothetical protein
MNKPLFLHFSEAFLQAVAFSLSLYSVVAFALLYESVMTPKIVG